MAGLQIAVDTYTQQPCPGLLLSQLFSFLTAHAYRINIVGQSAAAASLVANCAAFEQASFCDRLYMLLQSTPCKRWHCIRQVNANPENKAAQFVFTKYSTSAIFAPNACQASCQRLQNRQI